MTTAAGSDPDEVIDLFDEIMMAEYDASVRAEIDRLPANYQTGLRRMLSTIDEDVIDMYRQRLDDIEAGRKETCHWWTPSIPITGRDKNGKPIVDDQHNIGFLGDAAFDRGFIVAMSPARYLGLAAGGDDVLRHASEPEYRKRTRIPGIEDSIRACRPIETPYITISSKHCQITGHEGRHRAAAAHNVGVSRMTVIVYPDRNSDAYDSLKCIKSGRYLPQEQGV